MGNRPLEMMDREKAYIPELQISFMEHIAMPIYKYGTGDGVGGSISHDTPPPIPCHAVVGPPTHTLPYHGGTPHPYLAMPWWDGGMLGGNFSRC